MLFWLGVRTLIFSVIVVGADIAASGSGGLYWTPETYPIRDVAVFLRFPWQLMDPDVGLAYVKQMLVLLGVPGALLVALTSLAILTLSPYGNPSLLLLQLRRPRGFWRHLFRFVFGRGNPFLHALQDALYVASALAGLWVFGSVRWTGSYLPALAIVTVFALLEIALLLNFVLWVIRLRQPFELLQYMKLLVREALQAFRSYPDDSRLREARKSEVRGPYTCRYEEQEEVKQLTLAITHATLRALNDGQPFSSLEGLDVLESVYVESQKTYPPAFRHMRWVYQEEDPETNWLSRLAIDGFREVLFAALAGGHTLVRQETQRRLASIASGMFANNSPDRDHRINSTQIFKEQYAAAYARSVGRDAQTRHDLLGHVNALFGQISPERQSGEGESERAKEWREALQQTFAELAEAFGGPCVLNDDVPALRGVTDFMQRAIFTNADLRGPVAEVTLNLGATGIAVRADHTVSMLAGWVGDIFDPKAEIIPKQAARSIEQGLQDLPGGLGTVQAQLLRPDYVTVDYVQVFLVLVAARARQYRQAAWATEAVTTVVRGAVYGLGDKEQRPKWVCERVAKSVGYAEEEVRTWVGEVNRVLGFDS